MRCMGLSPLVTEIYMQHVHASGYMRSRLYLGYTYDCQSVILITIVLLLVCKPRKLRSILQSSLESVDHAGTPSYDRDYIFAGDLHVRSTTEDREW